MWFTCSALLNKLIFLWLAVLEHENVVFLWKNNAHPENDVWYIENIRNIYTLIYLVYQVDNKFTSILFSDSQWQTCSSLSKNEGANHIVLAWILSTHCGLIMTYGNIDLDLIVSNDSCLAQPCPYLNQFSIFDSKLLWHSLQSIWQWSISCHST